MFENLIGNEKIKQDLKKEISQKIIDQLEVKELLKMDI